MMQSIFYLFKLIIIIVGFCIERHQFLSLRSPKSPPSTMPFHILFYFLINFFWSIFTRCYLSRNSSQMLFKPIYTTTNNFLTVIAFNFLLSLVLSNTMFPAWVNIS
ncbi:hypothetical protein V8G54_008288 [Vigna mungo]|uniref:Uncharacterized protein n=1 Tax=Vigna mungo TaxID=3915 RepID=A0AAQ3P2W1_VIGMU